MKPRVSGPNVAALHAEAEPFRCLVCSLPPRRGAYLHHLCGHRLCRAVLMAAQVADSRLKRPPAKILRPKREAVRRAEVAEACRLAGVSRATWYRRQQRKGPR